MRSVISFAQRCRPTRTTVLCKPPSSASSTSPVRRYGTIAYDIGRPVDDSVHPPQRGAVGPEHLGGIVHGPQRWLTPATRITRATRLRPTATPAAASSAWGLLRERGAPQRSGVQLKVPCGNQQELPRQGPVSRLPCRRPLVPRAARRANRYRGGDDPVAPVVLMDQGWPVQRRPAIEADARSALEACSSAVNRKPTAVSAQERWSKSTSSARARACYAEPGMFDTLTVTVSISFDDGRVRLSPLPARADPRRLRGGLMAMMVLDGLVRSSVGR